jgi:hypothetical protein
VNDLGHSSSHPIPTYQGAACRRLLVGQFGLPNAAPFPGEFLFTCTREVFVDDDHDGRPVAYWIPDPAVLELRAARKGAERLLPGPGMTREPVEP